MESLSDRKQALLQGIINEYIHTAHPVGSQWLVDKLGLTLSPATIRNEMKELEEQGYITHPHTSAGRIPTETGYRYYVEHFLDRKAELAEAEKKQLAEVQRTVPDDSVEASIKRLAKQVAAMAQDAVLLTFNRHSYYYTGISYLFRKPEFQALQETAVLSELIDHLDDVMEQLHQHDIHDIDLYVGSSNPVSDACTTLVTRYPMVSECGGVIAILGPLRMNYQHNYQLLRQVQYLLHTPHYEHTT